MKLRLSYGRLILVALFLLLPVRAPAAQTAESSSIGWAGLWNNEMVEWAENANRVYKLCPKSMSRNSYEQCRRDNLAEKNWIIQAYNSPNESSEKVGEILITVKPGSSFVASFKDNNGAITEFEPDLFDQDWGYGPYFHQTILDRKDDWIKIPIISTGTPVWINPNNDIKHLDIITITEGVIYRLGNESIVITKEEGDTISFRAEQESDLWCEMGDPPEPKASEIKKIKIKELYDKNNHLMLDITYKRGC